MFLMSSRVTTTVLMPFWVWKSARAWAWVARSAEVIITAWAEASALGRAQDLDAREEGISS